MERLDPDELKRYSRHLVLEHFGVEAQFKIKDARVLVVGAGGLGCPALLYLAAAGVGRLGIVDDDTVDVSNLQRQILYTESDIGKRKVDAAANRIKALNSRVNVVVYSERLTGKNVEQILFPYDIVIDGTDNFSTRYLLNDAAVLFDKVLIYGSILKFEGHVSVFNAPGKTGRSGNYRDLFPVPPSPETVPNCEMAGVIGVLPGIVGALQANEAIKAITGIGDLLTNKLLIFDSLTVAQHVIQVPNQNARESIISLIDYDEFCGISHDKNKYLNGNTSTNMKEVTVQELKKLKESGADFQLIDVREPHEYDICNLEGELIPMSEIPHHVDKIAKDKQVIMHCRSGKRSGDMLLWLEKNHGLDNLYNLKGGILAWAKDIDPEMPTY